jgi:hypothetical protein
VRLPNACPKPRKKRKKAPARIARSPIKKKKRPAKEQRAKFEREYGGANYHAFVVLKPCCACELPGATVAHHTENGGKGRKADARTLVPLCGTIERWRLFEAGSTEGCHNELHRIGVRSFEARYGVDLKAIAATLWTEFQESHAD